MKEGIGACLIDKPEFIADVVRQNIPMQFTYDVGQRSSDGRFCYLPRFVKPEPEYQTRALVSVSKFGSTQTLSKLRLCD